jgi:hypothetical protein
VELQLHAFLNLEIDAQERPALLPGRFNSGKETAVSIDCKAVTGQIPFWIFRFYLTQLRWTRHVARMGERKDADRVLVGKPGGRKPLGKPKRRWEDNTKVDLREVG